MLNLNLLGPPGITLDGRPVKGFATAKIQIIPYYLAIESGCPHLREKLARLLWGELPRQRSQANLRRALHDLQKLLPEYLIVTRRTVAFDVSRPHQVDAVIFDRVLSHPKVEIDRIKAASSLYKGEFLSGFRTDNAPELEEWLSHKREHYRTLFMAALEKLADHHALQGEWEQVTDATRQALKVEPWHEISHRRLMLALARQGNYNAALAQYEACRLALEEELGVAPADETTALYERIQRARATNLRHTLPGSPGKFIGRQAELSLLDGRMNDPGCRLICLVGPGGIGKTRLAQALLARHVDQFLDGIYYVPLVSVSKPQFIANAIAETVGVSLSGPTPPKKQLIDALAGQELLVVLDGFEHLVSGADIIVDVLQGAPGVKIIVTSRQKLDLQDEWVFTVEGLSTPPEEVQDAAILARYDSITHFMWQAIKQRSGFVLEGREIAVSRLCRILGGSPLGIELAATLLPMASCAQIIEAVEQSMDVLTSTRRDVPERHRSLRAVFDHSWRLLETREQHIFPRLSVFRGSFSLEAASQVSGADLLLMSKLVAKSLVQMITGEEGASTRYMIHETIRQYAEELLLSDPPLCRQTTAAHIAYYAGYMRRQAAEWQRGEQKATIDAMVRELSNIRLAFENAVSCKDTEAIGDIIPLLFMLYEARSWYQEGDNLYTWALEKLHPKTSSGERFVWSQLSRYCAVFKVFQGLAGEAQQLARQAFEALIYQERDEPIARATNTLGVAYLLAGDYGAAADLFQESLSIYRNLDNPQDMLAPLCNLGFAHIQLGHYTAAKEVLEEGLAISYQHNVYHGQARFLNTLGILHYTAGDWSPARDYFEQALLISQGLSRDHLRATILINLSKIHVNEARFEQALASCQTAVDLMRRSNDQPNQVGALTCLGLAHRSLGNHSAAWRCLYEGLEISLSLHNPPSSLCTLVGAAILLLDGDQHEAGIKILRTAAYHPATEQADRLSALQLLAGQNITLSENELLEEQHSPDELTSSIVFAMEHMAHLRPKYNPQDISLSAVGSQKRSLTGEQPCA
ncbi:MAG: tetratricopeptide repeat protein [Anaerolineae bacterium]|nr:tetratricopeptide repeat protein [Anaerolineae bacterium]